MLLQHVSCHVIILLPYPKIAMLADKPTLQ